MLINFNKDYEKIIFAGMLIVLAFSAIVALRTVNIRLDTVDGGTKGIFEVDVPDIMDHSVSLRQYAGILTPHKVVYCRNITCNNLISKKLARCPACSTAIYKTISKVDKDINNNSIPDDVELSWGGSLDDPLNRLRDFDGDGFSNVDEYNHNESAHDPQSHPLNIYLASFKGIEVKFLPIVFNSIDLMEVNGKEKIYISGRFRDKGGFYKALNEEIYGFTLINFNQKKQMVSALYNDEEIVFPVNQKVMVSGWPKYLIHFKGEIRKVMMGEKLYLGNEAYTLISQTKEILTFESGRSSENIFLKQTPALLSPVK